VKPVAVTGLGVISPLGCTREAQLRALREGQVGIRVSRSAELRAMGVAGAGEVDFDPAGRNGERVELLALEATRLALQDAGLAGEDLPARTEVCVSTSKGPVQLLEASLCGERPEAALHVVAPDSASRLIAGEFGLEGPASCRVAACATGLVSVTGAASAVAAGRLRLAIAGAAEASLTPFIHAGFRAMGALVAGEGPAERMVRPFDRKREGFLLGEGAAVFVLEDLSRARQRGARVRVLLSGWAELCDAFDLVMPLPGGRTEFEAARLALERAGCSPDGVAGVWLHGTATARGDRAEIAAVERLANLRKSELPATATKSLTGHMLGASGAVELGFAAMCLEAGFLPAIANLEEPIAAHGARLLTRPECGLEGNAYLVVSAGFGGHVAAVVLKTPQS